MGSKGTLTPEVFMELIHTVHDDHEFGAFPCRVKVEESEAGESDGENRTEEVEGRVEVSEAPRVKVTG